MVVTIENCLFVGPLPSKNQIGGITTLFEDLVGNRVEQDCIFDTNTKNYTLAIVMLLKFVLRCISARIKGQFISFHGTAADYQILGPILVLFRLCIGLRYSTRKFAGDFDVRHKNMNIVSRFLVNVLLRQSDSNFFETKHLVNTYKNLNRKTYWFPNYRQDSKSRISSSYNHRFIYLGRVCKEKGILDLAEALSLTSTKITVDVYGPIEDISEEIFNERLLYKGVIGRDEIYETLSNYSALVLPSYREGYAGVVVEAMCVGIPLVLSNLPTLREMVEPPAAVFFEPGSSNDLAHCLQVIEKDYSKMRLASRDSFSKFEKFRVLSQFFIDSEIALN